MIYDFSAPGAGLVPSQLSADFRSDQQQQEPQLQLHQPDSPDVALADRLAREQVRVAGAHALVYVRTDNGDYDETFSEDADPTYYPPKMLRCYFQPQPLQLELKQWGLDGATKTEGVFALGDLKEAFPGRLLRAGDVLELPYNHPIKQLDPGFYRVINATPSGNFRYNWLYMTVQLEALSADATVRVRQDIPPETPLNPGGAYFG